MKKFIFFCLVAGTSFAQIPKGMMPRPKPLVRPGSPWLLPNDAASLIERLKKNPHQDVRAESALVLSLASVESGATAALVASMKDENVYVRACAAWALVGEFYENRPFIPFCENDWAESCFSSLRSAIDKEVVERGVVLWEFARQDAKAKPQSHRAKHLGNLLKDDVKKALLEGLSDSGVGVRHQSLKALAQISEVLKALGKSKESAQYLPAAQAAAKEIELQIRSAIDTLYVPELNKLREGKKLAREDEFVFESQNAEAEKTILRIKKEVGE